MNEPSWRERWRWLFMLFAALSLVWVAWLLWDALPVLRENLPKLGFGWLLFTLIGGAVSVYVGFEAFRTLFDRMRPGLYGRLQLAHFYFVAQLMKHFPGRFWGVVYQAAAGHRATWMEWGSVAVVHMLLSMAFAVWIAMIVLGQWLGWWWAILAFATGAACYALIWNTSLLSKLLEGLRGLQVRPFVRLCDAVQPFVDVDSNLRSRVLFLFVVSWVLYLLSWSGFGLAWPGLDAVDGVRLCAVYTLAWLAGYLSFVTPSGLGVRELVFVGLAQGFPPDAVAGMAILGRVMLLLIDVMLGLVFMLCKESSGE